MSPDKKVISRRNVLKMVATSTVATGAILGTASAAPERIDSSKMTSPEELTDPVRVVDDISDFGTAADCTTEHKCVSEPCKTTEDERAYSRQCCQMGGGPICEDWEPTDQCCF